MATLISLLLFAILTAVISYYGYRRYARPGRILEQVGPSLVTGEAEQASLMRPSGEGFLVRTIRTIGEQVPVSPQDVSMARRYLIAAGLRSDSAVYLYYGIKVALCVGLLLAAVVLRKQIVSITSLQIVFVIAMALAGYFGPNLFLEHLVSARQERLKLSLPDALDLMVVAVEAGLGLDQAMQNVSRELRLTHKDICDELGLVTLEMRAGKRRMEALRNLAERTGQSDIRQLVGVLIQTDRFGTSMAESLRTHSDFLRIRRKQEAEERANKVGVKLVFPIFFCILPSMFLVTGGPAILAIFRQLIPLMRSTY